VRAELLDRFTTVGAFCDRCQIRLNFHETGDPFAHQWMVVDDEDTNWGAAGHDASPRTFAGVFRARSRDNQERLADVA
jgi:hypothetical protein